MFSLYLRFFVMTSQEYISVGIKKSVILWKLADSILEKITSTYFVFWNGTDGLLLVLYQFVTEKRERERSQVVFLNNFPVTLKIIIWMMTPSLSDPFDHDLSTCGLQNSFSRKEEKMNEILSEWNRNCSNFSTQIIYPMKATFSRTILRNGFDLNGDNLRDMKRQREREQEKCDEEENEGKGFWPNSSHLYVCPSSTVSLFLTPQITHLN